MLSSEVRQHTIFTIALLVKNIRCSKSWFGMYFSYINVEYRYIHHFVQIFVGVRVFLLNELSGKRLVTHINRFLALNNTRCSVSVCSFQTLLSCPSGLARCTPIYCQLAGGFPTLTVNSKYNVLILSSYVKIFNFREFPEMGK